MVYQALGTIESEVGQSRRQQERAPWPCEQSTQALYIHKDSDPLVTEVLGGGGKEAGKEVFFEAGSRPEVDCRITLRHWTSHSQVAMRTAMKCQLGQDIITGDICQTGPKAASPVQRVQPTQPEQTESTP